MKTKMGMLLSFSMLLLCPLVADAGKLLDPPPEVKAFSGTVTEWSFNDDFIYRGFYLRSGQTAYYVSLPKYLGKAVRALGSELTVHGVVKETKTGPVIRMVSVQGGGKTVYDLKPAASTTPSGEQFETGKAKITELYKNKKGEVYAFRLDNDTFLKIPSSLTRRLPQLERVGSEIEYTGVIRPLKEGEEAVDHYKVVRCQTISLNGTQYLVR